MSPIKTSKPSPTPPDMDKTAPLLPYMKAQVAKELQTYFTKPANGGPSQYMELLKMDAELRNKIEKLEEEIRRLRANLPKELKILCCVMSNPRRKKSHGRYEEFASKGTQRCEDRIAHIHIEIDDLKKGLNHEKGGD